MNAFTLGVGREGIDASAEDVGGALAKPDTKSIEVSHGLIERPELLQRVAFTLASILALYLVIITLLLPGITAAKIVGIIAVLTLIAAGWAARHAWGYRPAAISLVGVTILGVFGASLTNGGADGYVTPLIITAPMSAAIFLGTRAALIASGGVIAALIALIVFSHLGWVSETPYPPDVTTVAAAALLTTATLILAAALATFAGDARMLIATLNEARLEADRANAAKSEFLSNMSHELRTPLNGVLGMAQVMRGGPLNREQTAQLDIILKSGAALQDLIQDVLDLSRIEAGQLDLAPVRFRLGDCLDEAVAATTGAAQAKGLTLTIEADAEMRALELVHDRSRLRQVLINLLGNAVKFSETGGATLRAEPLPQGRLCLTVSDTGPGIAPEFRDQIFERFAQGDAGLKRASGGTGLGLTIAREIIEVSGGTISLGSETSTGASFHIDLPLKAPERVPDTA